MTGAEPVAEDPTEDLRPGEGRHRRRRQSQARPPGVVQEDPAPPEGRSLADHQHHPGEAESDDGARPAAARGCGCRPPAGRLRCGRDASGVRCAQQRSQPESGDQQDDGRADAMRGGGGSGLDHRCSGHPGNHRADAPGRMTATQDRALQLALDLDRPGTHRHVEQAVGGAEHRDRRAERDESVRQAYAGQGQRHQQQGDPDDPCTAEPGDQSSDELHADQRRDREDDADGAHLTVRQTVGGLQRRLADEERRHRQTTEEEDRRHRPAAGRDTVPTCRCPPGGQLCFDHDRPLVDIAAPERRCTVTTNGAGRNRHSRLGCAWPSE